LHLGVARKDAFVIVVAEDGGIRDLALNKDRDNLKQCLCPSAYESEKHGE